MTGELLSQKARNAENVFIWWRHNDFGIDIYVIRSRNGNFEKNVNIMQLNTWRVKMSETSANCLYDNQVLSPCISSSAVSLMEILHWYYDMKMIACRNTHHGWMHTQHAIAMISFLSILTHWGRDKMDAVSQTTLSKAFSWMKMLEFRLRFHWSLFLYKGPINNSPALVQIMAWRRSGDKPLSEPMLVCLLTHMCVTRPQWVKAWSAKIHVKVYEQ